MAEGELNIQNIVPVKKDDVFTLCLTSGSTGKAKAAMITHENMLSTLTAMQNWLKIVPNDVHYSYLPLAHIFERVFFWGAFASGCSIGFYSG